MKEIAVANVEEVLLPKFSSRILMDSCLTLRSFVYFEFIFVYAVREWSSFLLLYIALKKITAQR